MEPRQSDALQTRAFFWKKALIVAIEVLIGLLHFVTGRAYRGPFPAFVNGYLLDILIPFGFYFLLCLPQHRLLQPWWVKALLVFGAAAGVETAQGLGYPLLGRTYDPLDFLMYAAGVLLAVLFDTLIFPRHLTFWRSPA